MYPSAGDRAIVEAFLAASGLDGRRPLVAIAPGTVWNTKRWPAEKFAETAAILGESGMDIVLVGGEDDQALAARMIATVSSRSVSSAVGKLSLLQSAELLRRCRVLVCNDSAPAHLAVSVGTPVVAIFGATVPEFGFAPRGERDAVVEIKGLSCRPCSSHGGDACPIKTFECMLMISARDVSRRVAEIVDRVAA